MNFQMIQDDIDKANGTFCNCPLARCLNRTLPNRSFQVGFFSCWDKSDTRYQLSQEAAQFRQDYDDKKPVQPISFTLDIKE